MTCTSKGVPRVRLARTHKAKPLKPTDKRVVREQSNDERED